MNLTPHITIEEFVASDTAKRLGIDNSLPASLLIAATNTAQMLEQIRDKLSQLHGAPVPLQVTSGYRCAALNAAVGSAPTSDHTRAMAADIKAPTFGSPYQVARALSPLVGELGIGQLIYEFGTWVHVSARRPDNDINRIITMSHAGTQVGVQLT